MCGGCVSSWDATLTLLQCGASYAQLTQTITFNNYRLLVETHLSTFELQKNVLLSWEITVGELWVPVPPFRVVNEENRLLVWYQF